VAPWKRYMRLLDGCLSVSWQVGVSSWLCLCQSMEALWVVKTPIVVCCRSFLFGVSCFRWCMCALEAFVV
jgi:hypothetical protein